MNRAEQNELRNITLALADKLDAHRDAFRARLANKPWASTKAGDKGERFTPLRNFAPVNPLDEWVNITKEPMIAVARLHARDCIEVIELNGSYYARTK